MNRWHRIILALSCAVVIGELGLLVYYHVPVFDWLSHHLWVVVIPFSKVIIKRLLALKLVVFFKGALVLILNLIKLLALKVFKTLSIRYGMFFTQNRWYWVRRSKVVFLRRGKQLFRSAARFWRAYSVRNKGIILVAFFPVAAVLFFLGLSFNVTRKTMVQKTQETALFEMATSASNTNRGIRAWVKRLDRRTLEKIRELTPKAKAAKKP